MNTWEQRWFGPVAAIRPYLFQKCFLLMLALDLLVLMVERGGRYGLDAVSFNVSHFRWLQHMHQLVLPFGVPSATYYVAFLVVTSFLTLVTVFVGHRRWLLAIVAVLYTYCWSMSRLDSYLHHYMLTLILSCMVFFPGIDARLLRDGVLDRTARKHVPGARWLSLGTALLVTLAVIYRLLLSQVAGLNTVQRWGAMLLCGAIVVVFAVRRGSKLPTDTGPLVSSWAYRLLGTTVGVIYIFTAVAKMDAEWCGGYTLREVGSAAFVLQPVEQLAATLGVSPAWFWSALATLVIPLELLLAFSYLLAVGQDEPKAVWRRRLGAVAWVLAMGLHLNNEMMNLIIQWFGYYMVLLATLILLPSRFLLAVGCIFYWPESLIRERYEAWVAKLSSGQATMVLGLLSMFALFVIILAGFFIWIAGARVAVCVLAAVLVLVLIVGMVLGWERRSIGVSLSSASAALVMIAATAQSSLRFDYYDLRGKTLQQMGQHQRAILEMNEALIFPPSSAAAAAEVHTNLGLSYRRVNQPQDAEQSYRRAIALSSNAFLAHYSLANMYVELKRYAEAEQLYKQALLVKPDFSDAYVNLGNLLEFLGRVPEAIDCYRQALVIEPQAADIRQLLHVATQRDP